MYYSFYLKCFTICSLIYYTIDEYITWTNKKLLFILKVSWNWKNNFIIDLNLIRFCFDGKVGHGWTRQATGRLTLRFSVTSKKIFSCRNASLVGFFPPYLLDFLWKDSRTSNASSVSLNVRITFWRQGFFSIWFTILKP